MRCSATNSIGGDAGIGTIARTRRAHFVDGKSVKQITRDFDLARSHVLRVLRSVETVFSYEREV